MNKFRLPNTYVIIALIIVLSAMMTWFIPGGQYVKAEDGSLTYEVVESVPQTWQVFTAVYHGFVKQAGIIIFILVVGGAFWLLNATGAVETGIKRFIVMIGDRDKMVLVLLTVLFSLAGAVFGMSEETIPFVGICLLLSISMFFSLCLLINFAFLLLSHSYNFEMLLSISAMDLAQLNSLMKLLFRPLAILEFSLNFFCKR